MRMRTHNLELSSPAGSGNTIQNDIPSIPLHRLTISRGRGVTKGNGPVVRF